MCSAHEKLSQLVTLKKKVRRVKFSNRDWVAALFTRATETYDDYNQSAWDKTEVVINLNSSSFISPFKS